jgi:hypothetical protein
MERSGELIMGREERRTTTLTGLEVMNSRTPCAQASKIAGW